MKFSRPDRFSRGWTWWQWCRGGGYCFLDQTDAAKPNAQLLVQPYARAVAGEPLKFAYDPATRTYTLTFRTRDNAAGPTRITVPTERTQAATASTSKAARPVAATTASPSP
ncbi:hypothetical protein ACWGLP_30320 [Streptomyces lydicus]